MKGVFCLNRINEKGMLLIDYKTEYMKHHSPVVDKALLIALETFLEKKELDEETFDLIKDDNVNIETLRNHLLLKKEYSKSPKELFKEFEKVRARVNAYLKEIGFINCVETESNVEASRITVMRQYNLPKEFLMEYFGVNEEDMIQLMKKRGFMEKFAVLRMNKVFKEIYNEMKEEQYITHGFSLVYFNRAITGFSVDYKYHLNVDFIANEENMKMVLKKIKEVDRIVEKKYNKKMSINLYEHLHDKVYPEKPDGQEILSDYIPQNKKKEQLVEKEPVIIEEKTATKKEETNMENIVEINEPARENTEEVSKPIEEKTIQEIIEKKEKHNKAEHLQKQKPIIYRPGQNEQHNHPKEELEINIGDIEDEPQVEMDIPDDPVEDIDMPIEEFDIVADDLM